MVFVDYKGITVAQDTELRKQFREAGVEYSVVKNTLTNFATKNCGYDFSEVLNGTTAMASMFPFRYRPVHNVRRHSRPCPKAF